MFIFYILRKVRTITHKPGAIAATFLIGYAPVRFGMDFFRAQDEHWQYLTFAQWGCLVGFLLGLFILHYPEKKEFAAV